MPEIGNIPHVEQAAPLPVAVLVRDLMLASQIRVAAKDKVALLVFRDPQQLASLPIGTTSKLIVDLNLPGAIEAASAYKCRMGQEVTGFVSHVDTQTIAQARQAGLDRVLARSAFFKDVLSFLA